MPIKFNTANFHDTYILAVLEDTAADTLVMTVDYPANWRESVYEKRLLLFSDAFNYRVEEIRFEGSPEILEIESTRLNEGILRFRLNTNAGYREISCSSVEFLDEKLTK
ncbi:MAG: hypothetical protein WKF92_06575 [Pyrinomonadaceae bacterium]